MLEHELERSPPFWYAVCTLLFSCSLCLTRTGHPEIPWISTAAASAGLHTGQAAGREYATSLPSLLCTRASNRALGMCCNHIECQIALLNWAFLEFSGDRPVREETHAPKGENVTSGTCYCFTRETPLIKIMKSKRESVLVSESLWNQIGEATTTGYSFSLSISTFSLLFATITHNRQPIRVKVGEHVPGCKGA